ncbi:zinc ribbon domain-containing protein [Flavilitoribacter nigricans]|uniref:Uncharacterized protein n=1 Tax=Flavilitoribacter nigricans (strain ATCC 23147 / DSM 23189 / NBRC 102662 / NCIMB 1420 / SS-2) TaxID=1122177 RepID=A0A2D0N9H8_FLAN2|nr:hypothetical protein [Flavilitoribacter nigricans]PHN04799.1 hypothetical protein CRP01_20015 [Flavilitoribacter nigricans DSM 23189 = NBRC 102662]
MHLQLACPNCATSIKAENINITSLVAKCHHCNSVFNFSNNLEVASRNRPEIMLPPGFEAYTTLSSLDIEFSWRQSSKGLGFFIFFALFWNGILSIFVVTALLTGELQILLFTSVHLLVGISLIYYILTVLMNKTYVLVSQREILIEHRPLRLPFYPNRSISAMDLDQLYISKYVSSRTNGRPNHAFSVIARLRTGSEITLIKGLRQPEQATFIEQQIEKFLHIEDRAMEGEYGVSI